MVRRTKRDDKARGKKCIKLIIYLLPLLLPLHHARVPGVVWASGPWKGPSGTRKSGR